MFQYKHHWQWSGLMMMGNFAMLIRKVFAQPHAGLKNGSEMALPLQTTLQ